MDSATEQVGVVSLLARYPVKSMGGEQLAEVELDPRGVVGDRQWAVYTADGGIGSGKSTRRFRRVDGLLRFRASLPGTVPVVDSPTGERFRADEPMASEVLSTTLGQPLVLRREGGVPHHDEAPAHVVTSAAVRWLGQLLGGPVDVARFRANIVLDVEGTNFPEDNWEGRAMRLGNEVVLRLGSGMPRCVMVDLAQDGLQHDGRILKELAQSHQLAFGLQAHVVRGGTVRRGDPACLTDVVHR